MCVYTCFVVVMVVAATETSAVSVDSDPIADDNTTTSFSLGSEKIEIVTSGASLAMGFPMNAVSEVMSSETTSILLAPGDGPVNHAPLVSKCAIPTDSQQTFEAQHVSFSVKARSVRSPIRS